MELLFKMLRVPVAVITVLIVWGLVYKRFTGKPFISFNDRPEENSEDEIVDEVTIESMQGQWRMVSVGRNGNFAPDHVIAKSRIVMTVAGSDFRLDDGDGGTFTLGDGHTPNHLDQLADDGDTHFCIVRFRNGQLEMCQAEVGKPRPSDFEANRRDGASLTRFERIGGVTHNLP